MMRQLLVTATVILAMSAAPATATTIHVPADQPTIQAGIDVATAGDTVLVACGTYYEHDVVMLAGISLVGSGSDADCVTIDAQQQGRVLFCDGLAAETRVRNLTLTGGMAVGSDSAGWGGGLFCTSANLLVRNVALVGNEAITGGGMWCADCSPSIDNVVFAANVSSYGGGLRVAGYGSVPVLRDCLLADNIATVSGGGVYTSSSTPHIVNTTFYRNSAPTSGSAVHSCNRETTIENSLIVSCIGPSAVACDIGGSASLTCCDVFGNGADWTGCIADQFGVNGNISADPMFCDPDNGNFMLDVMSPCAPDNNSCGVLIGAYPVGCGASPVEATSWSRVKAMYR